MIVVIIVMVKIYGLMTEQKMYMKIYNYIKFGGRKNEKNYLYNVMYYVFIVYIYWMW